MKTLDPMHLILGAAALAVMPFNAAAQQAYSELGSPGLEYALPGRSYIGQVAASKFDLQNVTIASLVGLLYAEAIKTPYMLSPEVLRDERLISVRYSMKAGSLADYLAAVLKRGGYKIEHRSGVDFVVSIPEHELLEADHREMFVYQPAYRNAHYLARQVQPLFDGKFAINRTIPSSDPSNSANAPPEGSAAAAIDQQSDSLLFHGGASEIAKLKSLLPLLDIAVGEVIVRAAAYEVSDVAEEGSAFHAALKLLGQGLTIGSAPIVSIPNALRLKFGSADAVFHALSQDSRFKVLNTPNMRIRSGARGKLTIGQKVPILGALTYARGSTSPIQSVEYHSSGVIFELRPVVKDKVIDIHISQQISDFVKTTTGVNASPTLNTREIVTDITVEDGAVVILGGLTTDKASGNNAGLSFLPRFLDAKASSRSRTEILLVLHVEKV